MSSIFKCEAGAVLFHLRRGKAAVCSQHSSVSPARGPVISFFMMKFMLRFPGPLPLLGLVLLAAPVLPQTPPNPPPPARPGTLEQGLEFASKGRCQEALPLLKKFAPRVTDKQLRYRANMATVRCAMNRKDDETTANTLLAMRHDFSEDPEVLYIITQYFLDYAVRASEDLAAVAPNSYQTRELQAESFETQNKWPEAAAIYRKIIEENPKLRGIHFRLGRAILSQPETPESAEQAKKEFEQEIVIDPINAAAEFWLGELARREGQWEDAVPHFAAATKLDSTFAQAFLALGMSLNSAGRFAEAVPSLEQYIKISPDDPAGHYQLSIAYARTERKEDSVREMTIQQQLYEKKRSGSSSPNNATPN
jgi:tetratricopeptide (TPR) repeat protein